MSNIEVVGLGALNIDTIYKVERILGDGETIVNREQVERILGDEETAVNRTGTFPGGSAANTIYGLARLGVSTGFAGVVGDDSEGKILVNDFQRAGVDASRIRVKPGARSGSALCFSDKLNFRSIHITPGANSLLNIDDIDLDYINQAEILHVSSFVDDTQFEVLLELVDRLHPSVNISFSPGALYATKGLKALTPILKRTHVLLLNENEIQQMTGKDVSAGAESCLEQGSHIIVVTLGKGASYKTVMATSYIRDAKNEYVVKPNNQNIISDLDTIGAGDAFATGFLYGLLKEKSLEECGRLGNIVAQFSIAKIGARQGLPTPDELAQRYRQLYNKQL